MRVGVIVALTTFASSASSCLLTRPIVADDAEVTLLTPPVIVVDPNATSPLPGSIMAVTGNSAVIRVTVARADDTPLRARAWLNRAQPFDPFAPGFPVQSLESLVIPAVPGTTRRQPFDVLVVLPETPRATCFRLDLYVSPEFQNESRVEHEPVRRDDVAYARWYLLREGNEGDPAVTARTCAGSVAGQ